MNPLTTIRRLLFAVFVLIPLVSGCKKKDSDIDDLVVCTAGDLYELQQLCLDHGGSFIGESSIEAETGCMYSVSGSAAEAEISDLSGECYLIGEGDCVTKCDLPENP